MSEFLTVLSFYYLCDSTAAVRPMSGEEIFRCTQAYETVKVYFVPDFELEPIGTLARFRQMQQGYHGFKAWERDNPELVKELRQNAEALVRIGF